MNNKYDLSNALLKTCADSIGEGLDIFNVIHSLLSVLSFTIGQVDCADKEFEKILEMYSCESFCEQIRKGARMSRESKKDFKKS